MQKSNKPMVYENIQNMKEKQEMNKNSKYQLRNFYDEQVSNEQHQNKEHQQNEIQNHKYWKQLEKDQLQEQDFDRKLECYMTIESYSTQQAKTKETSVLSIIQHNQIEVDLNEIIALYKQIDNKLFDHQFQEKVIIAEKNIFSNISEIENQRIILQSNSNSTIVSAFLEQDNKLIVMKFFRIDNQEFLIRKMDEYKIHHRVNKFYPQQSIELILPVQIQKDVKYQITSCIERADINLYDYSQNQQILSEEACIIFQQLLQQIINLHQINIAHRDIKPQNILYVKEKGWILSDFGESLEYREVNDNFDIRGTMYFLKSNIQKSIKSGQCKQNLLQNDLYALVVTIIMIQKKHYIKDIEQEIAQQNNELYHQILHITNLKEVIILQQNLMFKSHDYQPLITKKYLRKLSQSEQNHNQQLVYQSWLDLYCYFIRTQSQTGLIPHLRELVKKNLKTLLNFTSLTYDLIELQLISPLPSKFWIKNLKRFPKEFQQICIYVLFVEGLSEKIINIATEFLNHNYSQGVHMTLIDAYYRAQMFHQAQQQFKKFIDGLLFDFLDSQIQGQFFRYLMYFQVEHTDIKLRMDFKVEEQLSQRRNKVDITDIIIQLEQEQEIELDHHYHNEDDIVNHLFSPFIDQKNFNVLNQLPLLKVIDHAIREYPLDVLLKLLKRLQNINYYTFDINRKISFCFDTACIMITQNKSRELKQLLTIFRQFIFKTESWQQAIMVKLSYLIIRINQFLSSNQGCYIDDLIYRFCIALKQIRYITFDCYKQYIVQYILHLIKIMVRQSISQKSSKLLYIIEKCFEFAFLNNCHINNNNNFRIFQFQAQFVLLKLKSYNRCQLIVSNYSKFVDKDIKVWVKNYINKNNVYAKSFFKRILSNEEENIGLIQQVVTRKFLFNRYFN